MNWANRITVGRFFLTLAFVAAMAANEATLALGLFILAGLSDYLDGELARRYEMVTDFGKLMDPLMDKIMVAAAFITLVEIGSVPAWVATVVISREFLVTGLRLLALAKGRVLAAESMGKHKTAWQIITILFFLAILSVKEAERAHWVRPLGWLPLLQTYGGAALLTLAVGLTLYSGFGYLWRNRALIQTA